MLELELIFCVWFKASPTFWSYSFPTWNIFSTQFLVPVSAAAAAKSLQSCLTLCDPTDGSPPCSPVPGILQARTLEWVAISFSNARKWKVKVKSLSRVRLFATPWTAAHQAPPSMGFSRQEHWSGCHCLLHWYQWGEGSTLLVQVKLSSALKPSVAPLHSRGTLALHRKPLLSF